MWYLLLTNPLGIYYPLNIEWSFTEHETLEKKGFQLLYCTMREKREKKPLKKAHQLQREKISRFSATHALHSGQKLKVLQMHGVWKSKKKSHAASEAS